MRAVVKSDRTTRTIEIDLFGMPDIDVTQSYHRRTRIFRPDKARIRITDGVTVHLKVSGPLVITGDMVSARSILNKNWHRSDRMGVGEPIGKAPDWARAIWDQAGTGIKYWIWAGEGQPESVPS